jgi:hypothetical protein
LALRLLTSRKGLEESNVQPLPVDVLSMPRAGEHPLYPRALATAAAYAVERGDTPTGEQLAEAAMLAAEGVGSPDPLVEYLCYYSRGRAAEFVGLLQTGIAYFERAVEVARSAGLLYELAEVARSVAAAIAINGSDTERASALVSEALAVARKLGAPRLIAYDLLCVAGVLARQDPERAKALLEESRRTWAVLGDQDTLMLSVTVFAAALMGDWDQVFGAAPNAIRGFLWVGSHPNLAGMLNIVARALAPLDAETAAVLQGATRRLVTPGNTPRPGRDTVDIQPNPANSDGPATPSGVGGPILELRRDIADDPWQRTSLP